MPRFHRGKLVLDSPIIMNISGPVDDIVGVIDYSLNSISMLRGIGESAFVSGEKFGIEVLELKDESHRSDRISMMAKMRAALHKKGPVVIALEVKDSLSEVLLERWILLPSITGSETMARNATLLSRDLLAEALQFIKETSDEMDAIESENALLRNLGQVLSHNRSTPPAE